MCKMRKFIAIAIVAAMIASLGAAFAQSTQSHGVSIMIPNVLVIRIVEEVGGRVAATDPRVYFNFEARHADYITAVETDTPLGPTLVERFGDVIVFSNRENWSVHLSATPLTFTPLMGGRVGFLALPDIRVDPIRYPGAGVTRPQSRWNLGTTLSIATGVSRTSGWRTLGFGGSDYELVVHGDEEPGTYTTTVTYTITAP